MSGVELCLANAERLLIDAGKTSPPTAAALAELSIEEAAKAWMLFFRLLFQGREGRSSPRLSEKEAKPIADYLSLNEEYLSNLDDEILLAFERHKVKLRFLGFLLGYVEIALPILAKRGRLLRQTQELYGPAFNIQEVPGEPYVQATLGLIKSFRRENMTALDSVKQDGFYVNLRDKRDLISPEIQTLPNPWLLPLAAFLIVTLKGDLLALSR